VSAILEEMPSPEALEASLAALRRVHFMASIKSTPPGLITCRCGKLLPSMCRQCSERSFDVALADRRLGLLKRLDSELPFGIGYTAYEGAIEEVRRRLVKRRLLTHVTFGPKTGPAEGRYQDQDWFLTDGAQWDPIFTLIEAEYQKRLARARRSA